MSVWVKRTVQSTSNGVAYNIFQAWALDIQSCSNQVFSAYWSNNVIMWDRACVPCCSQYTQPNGYLEWTHVAAVYTFPAMSQLVYINGTAQTLQDASVMSGGGGNMFISSTWPEFYKFIIGGMWTTYSPNSYMYDFRLWYSTALDATQVSTPCVLISPVFP